MKDTPKGVIGVIYRYMGFRVGRHSGGSHNEDYLLGFYIGSPPMCPSHCFKGQGSLWSAF